MEPPSAIIKEELKQISSYSIISDKNHSFSVTFQNFNSIIEIKASYQEDILKYNYDKKITLNELKKNKYLGICETIDDIYGEIIRLMKSNKTKIFEATNQIFINIPVELFTVKELIFVVNEIPKNDSEKIEEVFNIISIMKKEIKNIR